MSDARELRLVEVRKEIQHLRDVIRLFPVGTEQRNAIADRLGELAGQAIALNEELEG